MNQINESLASIIVANRNGCSFLKECLSRLESQTWPNYEVIVIDDASTDGSIEYLKSYQGIRKFFSIFLKENRGLPHVRNLGFSCSRGQYVAFIDNDGYASADWLEKGIAELETNPDAGAVAPLVLFARKPYIINGFGGVLYPDFNGLDLLFGKRYDELRDYSPILWPMGCGMILKRSVLDKVFPIDEWVINYYEDVEIGLRINACGFKVVQCAESVVFHFFGGSSSGNHHEKSRMAFMLKYAPSKYIRNFVDEKHAANQFVQWQEKWPDMFLHHVFHERTLHHDAQQYLNWYFENHPTSNRRTTIILPSFEIDSRNSVSVADFRDGTAKSAVDYGISSTEGHGLLLHDGGIWLLRGKENLLRISVFSVAPTRLLLRFYEEDAVTLTSQLLVEIGAGAQVLDIPICSTSARFMLRFTDVEELAEHERVQFHRIETF